jgi:hypothetical protein|nr:hypothetical protein [Bradyrhizobium diazoefficiens]
MVSVSQFMIFHQKIDIRCMVHATTTVLALLALSLPAAAQAMLLRRQGG